MGLRGLWVGCGDIATGDDGNVEWVLIHSSSFFLLFSSAIASNRIDWTLLSQSGQATLLAQRVDNHVKEIKIVQEILGSRLRLHVVGDNLVEMQQFNGIGVGEGWSNHTLLKRLALSFGQEELGGQLANGRGVVLDTDLFGFTVYLDMSIEPAVVVHAR